MAYYQQDETQYLDPITSQYYTMQTYASPMMNRNYSPYGVGGGYTPYGAASYGNPINNMYQAPRTVRRNTGDISVVNRMLKNRQPYEYNVPSIASMFPSMTMPTMGNYQPTAYTGGAGQFLGGLLGNAPMTGVAPADMSSGAGRFV